MSSEDKVNTLLLSNRARHTFGFEEFLLKYENICLQNLYHHESNPKGLINLGASVNRLLDEEIQERLRQKDVLHFSSEKHQHFYSFSGTPRLRTALAQFFNRHLNPAEDVDPDKLIVLSGTTACLDALAFTLCDPGDVYIAPSPAYSRIFIDLCNHSLADPHVLPLSEQDGYALRVEDLESKILQLKSEKKNVKAFVLINPQNPLGDVYDLQKIRQILDVCARYGIHFIADQVYAFSLFDQNAPVQSHLSLANLPDPERTHFVWSFSKNFGIPGFRVGVIHTQNEAVLKVLRSLSTYHCCPSIIQDTCATILNDTKWLDDFFLPKMRSSLREQYEVGYKRLTEIGAIVKKADAASFLWVNLQKFLPELTIEAEMDLFHALLNGGVYVAPGSVFKSTSVGWFRVVFSVTKEELLKGLERMEHVLKDIEKNIKSKN